MKHKVVHKLPKSIVVNDVHFRDGLQTDYYKVSNPPANGYIGEHQLGFQTNFVKKMFCATRKLHVLTDYPCN